MILIISILTLFLTTAKAPNDKRMAIVQPEKIMPYEALSKAVDIVETNCNPFAIGDKHLKQWSYGIKQIRQVKLDWYNNRTGKNYTTKDCYSESVSNEIFMYHMMQYNDVDLAIRKWNGSGKTTFAYLKKVKKHL